MRESVRHICGMCVRVIHLCDCVYGGYCRELGIWICFWIRGVGDFYSGFLEVPKNAQAVTLVMGVSIFGLDTIRIEQGLSAS